MRSKLLTLRQHQRRFGWRRAVQLVASQPLEDLHLLRVGKVYALDLTSPAASLLAESAPVTVEEGAVEVRDLERAELEALVERGGDWFFPGAVRTSLERGDRCTAVLVAGQVTCSMWSTAKPLMQYGLTLAPPANGFFGYRLFTRPEFRGRKLQRLVRREIARRYRAQGLRWWVNTVYATNHASIRAALQLGFVHAATVTVVGPDRLCARWLRSHAEPEIRVVQSAPPVRA